MNIKLSHFNNDCPPETDFEYRLTDIEAIHHDKDCQIEMVISHTDYPSDYELSLILSNIPKRIDIMDRESCGKSAWLIGNERNSRNPKTITPSLDTWSSYTLWRYGEREEATEIETGDLSARSC